MPNGEDWLQDPLMEIGKGSYQYRKPKSLDERQYELWRMFHFTTRLKLDAADHFCRQVLGAASMPEDLGLPLLAHRELKWYLDAFFFESMSAYEVLLQELNIVYAYDLGLKPDEVRWKDHWKKKDNIRKKLPEELVKYMEKEWEKEWFDKVRRYRNMAAHHHSVPTSWTKGGFGDRPWDYDYHNVSIPYLDSYGQLVGEKISCCPDYLKKMVEHIHRVWQEMAQEFE